MRRVYRASIVLPVKRTATLLAFVSAGCAAEAAGPPSIAPAPIATPSAPVAAASSSVPYAYPKARRVDVADELHGVRLPDPYRWLEDGKSPEVQAWVDAEDRLARDVLAKLPGRDAMAARMRELLCVERVKPPVRRGGRLFYAKRDAGKLVYVREPAAARDRVLLDPTAWASDGSLSLAEWEPSWDGEKVAYTARSPRLHPSRS